MFAFSSLASQTGVRKVPTPEILSCIYEFRRKLYIVTVMTLMKKSNCPVWRESNYCNMLESTVRKIIAHIEEIFQK